MSFGLTIFEKCSCRVGAGAKSLDKSCCKSVKANALSAYASGRELEWCVLVRGICSGLSIGYFAVLMGRV